MAHFLNAHNASATSKAAPQNRHTRDASSDTNTGINECQHQAQNRGRVGSTTVASLRAPSPSAILVGGGIAGLTAARDLKQAGWDVQVLEARARLGGRLWTCRDNGLATELGGEFIDSESLHTWTHALAQSLGVEMVPSQMHRQVYEVNGRQVKVDELDTLAPDLKAAYDRFWAQAEHLALPINLDQVIETPDAQSLDQRSLGDWMDSLNIRPELRPILDRELALEYGDPRQASLLHFAFQTKLYSESAPSEQEMYRIKGGTQSLIDGLEKILKEDITCNAPVSTVNWQTAGVTVSYNDRSSTADYLVLATPLPPLRKVSFSPPLPKAAQEAITGLTYADHNKAVLFYDQPLVHEDLDYVQTQGPLGGVWYAPNGASPEGEALSPDGGARICYNIESEAFNQNNDPAHIAHTYSQAIGRLDRKPPVVPDRFFLQNWRQDAYAGGSYSSYGPGEVCAHWQILREPCGPIVFAGEHTATRFTGYIEGAIESGHRAARQLIAAAASESKKRGNPRDEIARAAITP
jgi:monoamine oxidase